MINSRNLRHDLHRDPYLANFLTFNQLIYRAQILGNSSLNILKGLSLSSALGPTTRQTRTGNTETLLRLIYYNFIVHSHVQDDYTDEGNQQPSNG